MIIHLRKDLNWRQLIFVCRWTSSMCSTGSACSTCSTCSDWGSACWLRYLLHLKFFVFQVIIRERGREKGRRRERERKIWRKRERKRERKRYRERKRERKRESKKQEIKGKEQVKEKEKVAFVKRFFFLILAPDLGNLWTISSLSF